MGTPYPYETDEERRQREAESFHDEFDIPYVPVPENRTSGVEPAADRDYTVNAQRPMSLDASIEKQEPDVTTSASLGTMGSYGEPPAPADTDNDEPFEATEVPDADDRELRGPDAGLTASIGAMDSYGEPPAPNDHEPSDDPFGGYETDPRERYSARQQAPTVPEAAEAKGNSVGWIVATIADAVFNKGRGLGQIIPMWVAEGDKVNQTNYERKTQAMKDQAGLDQAYERMGNGAYGDGRGYNSPERLAIARENARMRQRQIDLQEDALALRAEQSAANLDPDHPATKAFASTLVRDFGVPESAVAGQPLNTLKQLKHQFAQKSDYAARDEIGAVSGSKAQSQVRPHVDQAIQISQRTKQDKIDIAKAGAAGRIEAEQEAHSGTVIPGLIVNNDEAYRQAVGDDPTRRKVQDSAAAYRSLMEATDRMIELRQKYGPRIPGEVQGEYNLAKTTAIGSITQLGASGVLNQGEWERYSKAIPDIDVSLSDVTSIAGYDIKLKQLTGVRRSIESTVDAKLYQWGVQYDYGSLPGRGGAAPTVRPETVPDANGSYGNGKVNGGRAKRIPHSEPGEKVKDSDFEGLGQ
jgi:hypothetical protein